MASFRNFDNEIENKVWKNSYREINPSPSPFLPPATGENRFLPQTFVDFLQEVLLSAFFYVLSFMSERRLYHVFTSENKSKCIRFWQAKLDVIITYRQNCLLNFYCQLLSIWKNLFFFWDLIFDNTLIKP